MSYPLSLRFKILAIVEQLAVQDANGQLMMYVKQKAFKLKESITVYSDAGQMWPLYHIAADRVIDFSVSYSITDADGKSVGVVRRKGMKSLWRSNYEIVTNEGKVFTASEENPWAKVADSFFGDLPVLGLLSGYVFHPSYLISANGSGAALRAKKQPSLLESTFRIDRLPARLTPDEERLLVIGMVVVLLGERRRG